MYTFNWLLTTTVCIYMFCCAITFFSVMCLSTCSTGLCTNYRWFLWGVASLPEGKSLDLCLVQLCAKHSLIPRPFPPPVFDRILYKNGNGLGMRLCKTQASKRYIKSLPLVPKDKRSCFSKGERSAVQLPLDHTLTLQKWDA